MKRLRSLLVLAGLLGAIGAPWAAWAQGNPTATRALQLSAFGGVTGVYTGLDGGKNLSVTAGADLSLPVFGPIRPAIEVRGRYPVDDGTIDSQRDVLGGLKVEFLLGHRLRPYADALFGRGQMNYGKGYLFGNYVYALTTTYVATGGAGIDYMLNEHFAVKVDAQAERWGSAPTASGNITSKVGTVGVVYYFTFDHGHGR